MNYTQYEFFTGNETDREWLIAILSEYDFEGFEEKGGSLLAFVPESKMNVERLQAILTANDLGHIPTEQKTILPQNWNEEWEKNFSPVLIADKVGIRAPFHEPMHAEMELIIEPKMSFGTGHHATTASVITLMLSMDWQGKSVLDFGSGTGILSIVAEKLGADLVWAIDNEEWAYHNCIENVARNGCTKINTIHGDETFSIQRTFDIILANINLNVVTANIGAWAKLLNKNGVMIVSGVLTADEATVVNEALKHNLVLKDIVRKDGWIAASFQHL